MTAPSANASTWNPLKASSYLEQAVNKENKELHDTSCNIRVMDKYCQLAEFANDYLELEFDIQRNGAGAVSVVLPGDTACRDHIFRNADGADAVVPIIIDTAAFQWTGQVDVASIIQDEDGVETVELTGIHDWDWCASVAMWPSPFAPLIAQFPKRMFGIGPIRTIVHTFYKANTLRLQMPLWRLPDLSKLFDPTQWFNTPAAVAGGVVGGVGGAVAGGVAGGVVGGAIGTSTGPQGTAIGVGVGAGIGAVAGGVAGAAAGAIIAGTAIGVNNPNYPLAVAPINPLTDTSKWCAVSARMQMGSELFEQDLKSSGINLTVKLVIPGEHEQPHPDFFGEWVMPTLYLDTEDHTGIVGPTGTVVDGLIAWFGELGDDLLGSILDSAGDPTSIVSDADYVREDAIGAVQRLFGVTQDPPRAIWLDGQYSAIDSGRVDMHKPLCRDVIVGGRSPGWVNSGIEVGIKQLLSFAGQYLGVGGLDALYQGQLSDVFMAWMRFSNPGRTKRAGPYLKPERVVATGSAAFTASGYMEGIEAMFDTRGYNSKTIKIRDGAPFWFGRDISIGEICGYELDSIIWTDYLTKATFRDSRDERSHWELTFGDGGAEEADGTKAHRKIAQLFGIAKDLATDVGVDLGLEIV